MAGKNRRALAVLTSGGDAPGMNAAVRAVVRGGIAAGMNVYAVYDGYQGLIENNIVKMNWESVSGIMQAGGTVIGTARSKEFRTHEGVLTAAENLIKRGIDSLAVIGGDGSLSGADEFSRSWESLADELLQAGRITPEEHSACHGLKVVGMVGSIDNDMANSDMTIGADTALHRITDAIDSLRSTAYSHQRTFIVEVMGRNCGYLAIMSAIACGASWVFIPERPPQEGWENTLCELLQKGHDAGRRDNIIILAEGAKDLKGEPITSTQVQQVIEEKLNMECRITILGHVQRGGSPSAYDRYMSTAYGYHAIKELTREDSDDKSVIVVSKNNRVTTVPLVESVEKTRAIAAAVKAGEYDKAEEMRGIAWGRTSKLVSVQAQVKPAIEKRENPYRIAVMTSGWPAPGMNSAIRSIVRMAMNEGHEVIGIEDGVEGLIAGKFRTLDWMEVENWAGLGGTKLGTNRTLPKESDYYRTAANLEKNGIHGLIIIGGWTAYLLASSLHSHRTMFEIFRIPLICIPASINNNLPGVEVSIGSDTALNTIVEAIDKIKNSSDSARRLFIVEVMGRYCGYLAMMSGMATGAEYIYMHEAGINVDMLQRHTHALVSSFKRGRKTALIIRNEHANPTYDINFISNLFDQEGGKWFDVRKAILGPMQQGGNPSPFDRIFAARLALEATTTIIKRIEARNDSCAMVGISGGQGKVFEQEQLEKMVSLEWQRPLKQWWESFYEISHVLANSADPENEQK